MKFTLLSFLLAASTIFSAQAYKTIGNHTSQPISISSFKIKDSWWGEFWVAPRESVHIKAMETINLTVSWIVDSGLAEFDVAWRSKRIAIEVMINGTAKRYWNIESIEDATFVETKDGNIVLSISPSDID